MNKFFLFSFLFLFVPLTCLGSLDDHDSAKLSDDQQHYVETAASFEVPIGVDAMSFVVAFEALKHVLLSKGICAPYSKEYIEYICSDEFGDKMFRVLTGQRTKKDVWQMTKDYFVRHHPKVTK